MDIHIHYLYKFYLMLFVGHKYDLRLYYFPYFDFKFYIEKWKNVLEKLKGCMYIRLYVKICEIECGNYYYSVYLFIHTVTFILEK